VNILVFINDVDVTDACLLTDTRISYSSSRRITTASLTVMGRTLARTARYDYAHYGEDVYGFGLDELYVVRIIDGRDGVTKLFEGQIFSMALVQSDTIGFEIFYHVELNDYASWLDRSICWGGYTLTLPNSDQGIVQGLVGHFCTQVDSSVDVASIVPVVQFYDWKGKTTRQVLDDMAALAGAEWYVDFNAVLHYRLASAAPVAAFALSTSADGVTSFPVKVTGFKKDFNNPVNRCYVRGSTDPTTGAWIEATYVDPVSVGMFGELSYSVVDEQITTSFDAALRAKSMVLRYAYPLESGNFTIWKDDLHLNEQVHITEDALGIDAFYIVRQMNLMWLDKYTVQYDCEFGASQPDLETLLRLMDQRSRWQASTMGSATPLPGSITDASIAVPPGLSASVIGSVNASTIVGTITSSQIGSVNAGAIVGTITSTQIATVSATSITGAITSGQIGSVNATSITGVVVTSQLANGIIDDLAKYAAALQPVPMLSSFPSSLPNDSSPPDSYFYYIPTGHFYQMNHSGTGYTIEDTVSGSLRFYHIGAITASSIVGLIVAAQINSITAGQITGAITAGQISSVNASSISGLIAGTQINTIAATQITGSITATQIGSVNASAITGTITSSQIASVNASAISGSITSTQIGSINAATITIGLVGDSQISGINGSKLTVGTVNSDKLNATSISVGGAGSKPGFLAVVDAGGSTVAQLGALSTGQYGGWFKLLGAGGSSYTTAKMYTDSSGNLFLRDADLSIANGSYTIFTSTSTFDATYASLAVKISGASGDLASMISRGFLVYNSGFLLGGLVRDPGVTNSLQLVMYNSSHVLDIIIDGQTGSVRADGGFSVAGTPGFNGTVPAGHDLIVSKGIVTGYV
jgi:hypothetical protein